MGRLMLNTLRTAIYTQPLVAAPAGPDDFITSISFNILADRLRAAMAIKRVSDANLYQYRPWRASAAT